MKIRKISYIDSPIFGNLELDFTDSNGKALNTIIIAGENGVGKSCLLNDIYELLNPIYLQNGREEVRVFEIELSLEEMKIIKEIPSLTHIISDVAIDENILIIKCDFSKAHSVNQYDFKLKAIEGKVYDLGNLHNETLYQQIFKILFSDTEINFTRTSISSVTDKNIDSTEIRSEKSNQNLANEITQLLIDIESLDALDFTKWARNNQSNLIDKDKMDLRMKRFTTSYSFMFPTKKFKEINHNMGTKEIIFEENGKEMSINQLSSGEKQIVFRGGFLLKNKESSKGALVLIDEPEISLHPNWQIKILNFFQKLFTNDIGIQTSQIIISTHSPFILHNINRKDDKVIILQKDPQGKVFVPEEAKFYGWTTEKIVQKAFNISNYLSPNKTTVFLEGPTDEKYYNKCLEIYNKTDKAIDFKWIGHINNNGNHENTGDSALNNLKRFMEANPDQIKNKIILFYDVGTNKPEEDIENLLIRRMKTNYENKFFAKGIENLLIIDEYINVKTFYKKIQEKNNNGEKSMKSLDKIKLCNYICDELGIGQQKVILANLNSEIDRLLSS